MTKTEHLFLGLLTAVIATCLIHEIVNWPTHKETVSPREVGWESVPKSLRSFPGVSAGDNLIVITSRIEKVRMADIQIDKSLERLEKSLYGAALMGFVVRDQGGSMGDVKTISYAMFNGKTNALEEWLRERMK